MSIWHWLVVALVVVLLFGSGRISGVMGDVAKGIKAFRRGMQDDQPTPPASEQPRVDVQPTVSTTAAPAPTQPTPTSPPAQPASPVTAPPPRA